MSIVLPIIMYYVKNKVHLTQRLFNVLAIISLIIFGNIAALSVRQILIDNTVFMTAIHGVFLNPFFLITGAYLGIFALYRLLMMTFEEKQWLFIERIFLSFTVKTKKNWRYISLNNQLKTLSNDIERLKRKLKNLTETKELTDPEVIEISQKLDVLLDEYDRIKKSES